MSLINVDSNHHMLKEVEDVSQSKIQVRIDIPRVITRDLQLKDMEYLLQLSMSVPDAVQVVELGGEDIRPAIIIGMGLKAQNKKQVRYQRYSEYAGRTMKHGVTHPYNSIQDCLRRTKISDVVVNIHKRGFKARRNYELESVELLVISEMNTFDGYMRTLLEWQPVITSGGRILLFSGSLNGSMFRAANRFAFQSGMNIRISCPSLTAYFMELHALESDRMGGKERWFAAPDWERRGTWTPLLDTYIHSHSGNKDCLLSLYAGDLTNSDTHQAFTNVSEYLHCQNINPENAPEIEITNSVALDGEFYIPLCGGALDSHLEKRYSLHCFDFSQFPVAA